MIRVGCGVGLVTSMLAACLLGAGKLRDTMVKFQWSSAIMRLGRVCVKGVVRISISGVGVGLRIKADSLILESMGEQHFGGPHAW